MTPSPEDAALLLAAGAALNPPESPAEGGVPVGPAQPTGSAAGAHTKEASRAKLGHPSAELPAGLSAHRLLQRAEAHQVEGLVHAAWADRPHLLPAEVAAALRLAYHRNGLRNRYLAERLGELLDALARRGIAAMPLKGAILAFSGYARPELRALGDVDLLVREGDFAGLRETLSLHGYRAQLPDLAAADLPLYAQCSGQIRFAGPRVPPIEVHFRLFNFGLPGAAEPAWEDAVEVDLGALAVLAPAPERFVLHLCLHAQQHSFALLRLFADLVAGCRRAPLAPERFAELARRHHLTTAASLALGFTAALLPAPAGIGGIDGIGGLDAALGVPARRRARGERRWRGEAVRALAVPLGARAAELPLAYLASDAPWRDKAAFLRRVAFPPPAWHPHEVRGWQRRHLGLLWRQAWRALRPRKPGR